MQIDRLLSDKIKGISFVLIIMVIYIHSYNILTAEGRSIFSVTNNSANTAIFLQNLFSQGVFRSAVPMFFTISGFLFFINYRSINDYYKKIRNRFNTILIPFVFWGGLVVVLYYIAQAFLFSDVQFTSVPIRDLGIYGLLEAFFLKPYNYPLWFLRDLILVILCTPIIYVSVKKLTTIWFVLTISLWLLDIGAGAKLFFYKSEVILFFSIGAYFALCGKKYLDYKMDRNTLLYLITIYISVLLVKTYLITFLNTDFTFLFGLMQKIIIVLGVLVLWNLSDYTRVSKIVLVNYTFLFYVFHEPLLMFIKKVCFYFFGTSGISSIVIYIISPLVVVTCLYVLGYFMKSHFPKFTFTVTGGRI
ncbi:acyltransferase family protein [Sulfurovum mangrovi]|uniref:acyltransferase family protein n=1 Tax=Sulfurovum mangrovi TaxID=2893889 RepID=UPI001E3A4D0D|nr:acyltransferase [Sulfurovum mangrovi]UFH59215.1 acyltransferase [Sulfurovum mangrovi]